ncbi:hypothetical protein CG740_28130 [Streptomyces sp. CB01201]|nr:hypothetical protein [Streptomyces sp. MAG02]PJM99758.1 hypothetical protein CG740_28130 [Streptomyces sp. CB01201]
MPTITLSGILSLGRWWIFLEGMAWVSCAVGLAVADIYAHRRRVTTSARCIHVESEPGGIARHTLERVPVASEKKLVTLRTKGEAVRPQGVVKISYDPKNAHEVFVAAEHPRISRLRGELFIAGIGFVQIFYVLIRWGIS